MKALRTSYFHIPRILTLRSMRTEDFVRSKFRNRGVRIAALSKALDTIANQVVELIIIKPASNSGPEVCDKQIINFHVGIAWLMLTQFMVERLPTISAQLNLEFSLADDRT